MRSFVSSIALASLSTLFLLTQPSLAREARADGDRLGYRHDGFYLRGGLGPGWISASPSYDGSSTGDVSTHGEGLAAELMVGGAVVPGVILGGALFYQHAFNPAYTADGVTYQPNADKSLNSSFLGPFIDWYPNPYGGFHLGAFLGFARLTMTNTAGDTTSYSPVGGEIGGMIGQDFWLGPQLSLGVAFHLAGGSVSGTPNGPSDNPRIGTNFGTAQVLVSLLFN
jgi:hypothetical protein